jgi:hypothetical protein
VASSWGELLAGYADARAVGGRKADNQAALAAAIERKARAILQRGQRQQRRASRS